jgi:transcription-repair coupling factor (superfamily II helicase)
MKAVTEPLKQSDKYNQIKEWLTQGETPVNLVCSDGADRVYLMNGFTREADTRLVITYSEKRAEELYEDFRFYDKAVYMYPSKDILFYSADIHGNSITRRRMDIFKRLINREKCTVILTVDALLDKIPSLDYLEKNIININVAEELDVEAFKKRLVELGYEKTDSVDGVGQFAIRGGIIDIFPLTEECPYRIDMWDKEIDTIKSFDVESQRSIEAVDSISIYPASELVLSKTRIARGIKKLEAELKPHYEKLRAEFKTEEAVRIKRQIAELKEQLVEFNAAVGVDSYVDYFYSNTVSLADCFGENTCVLVDEPSKVSDYALSYTAAFADSMNSRLNGGYILPGQMKVLFSYEDILEKINKYKTLTFSVLYRQENYIKELHSIEYVSKTVLSYKNDFEALVADIDKWKSKEYSMVLVSPSATRGKRLAENLMNNDITCFFSESITRVLDKKEVMVTTGRLRAGFEFPDIKLVVISEGDIFTDRFGSARKRSKKPAYTGEVIKNFEDISVGDYVIHERYGVGIYGGIEKVEVDHVLKDYVTIEYADSGKLYVLASEVDAIQKFSSRDGKKPKINKLGGNDWEKTRKRVQGHVANIAKELVELYARRQASQGFCYSEDTVWQKEFEEMFPYEETEDQVRAIAETKADMESNKIMDRLVCGDVGFGKTEVAIRAAFKAVGDSRQVAYLVPTTILAQQHYNTFKERMKDFPIEIRLLCRFCTPKEIKETLKDLKEGKVDIVIGTHRLLSKDVGFKKLGLLIIDEEQRFGVTHKEKIKQMKTNVDVLTLTATPIPRTLHMSLIGIRDMSVLEEPPVDRRAIQTYVMELDPELIREAIKRELARDGQVYYVYNRVNNIEEITRQVSALVPEAVVEYAHGQMSARQIEDIMYRFINKEIDVLVSTTIIETGLDIPNANTMIIHDADTFGLSQLYQLRGRVGRSDRAAYAFLMYRRDKLIKETAEKRLKAIREFTDLGSGIKVSMKDLEIRGAGNVLGADQSGHMEAVGYDLYCKMLNDAIKVQKGEVVEESFDTTIQLPFDAFIPADYVKNEFIKLDLYKRISQIASEEDYEDLIDEISDRFGELPKETVNLLDISLIKARANKAYITSIVLAGTELRFGMFVNARIDTDRINDMLDKYRGAMKFVVGRSPAFVLKTKKLTEKEIWKQVREVVEDITNILMV